MPTISDELASTPEPQHAFAISLNQVMERFTAEGIGRTKRRLAELCQKGTLEGRKFKTTHGETWFVTAASLDAAVQQIKSEEALAAAAGATMLEQATASDIQRHAGSSTPSDDRSNPNDRGGRAENEVTQPHHATAGDSMLKQAPAGSRAVEQARIRALDYRR